MGQNKREFHYRVGGVEHTVAVTGEGDSWLVTLNGRDLRVTAQPGDRDRLSLEIDGQRAAAFVAQAGPRLWVHVGGEVWALERSRGISRRAGEPASETGGLVRSAMPGRVLDLLVGPGESVRKGQPLLLLEAMKMELRIAAPQDGTVAQVHVAAGQVIERGALLVEITAGAAV